MLDADKGFVENDAAPLLPRRPAHLDVIERIATIARFEIRAAANAARREVDDIARAGLRALGRDDEYINRSWGQLARYGRAPRRIICDSARDGEVAPFGVLEK